MSLTKHASIENARNGLIKPGIIYIYIYGKISAQKGEIR